MQFYMTYEFSTPSANTNIEVGHTFQFTVRQKQGPRTAI